MHGEEDPLARYRDQLADGRHNKSQKVYRRDLWILFGILGGIAAICLGVCVAWEVAFA